MTRSMARMGFVVVLALAARAAAHQAPDADVNNRYLKVTLLPDKARVVYTLLYGERPGAAERRRMDTSGDGVLDEAERRAFAGGVVASLPPSVTLDGTPAPGWRVADVGVGDPPRATGGAFAIDLVLDAVYPDPRAEEHHLVVDDRAAVPLPGEAEVRIDESPGVRVREAHLAGASAGIELRYTFTGNAVAPGERAIAVRFSVDDELRPRRGRTGIMAALGGGLVAVLVAIAAARRRRARRAAR